MHMLVHIVQKSAQNDLMKGELEEALYVALKSVSKILRSEAQKIAKKCGRKDGFDVAVNGPLDRENNGAPLKLKFGSLSVLYILHSAEQTELLTFLN